MPLLSIDHIFLGFLPVSNKIDVALLQTSVDDITLGMDPLLGCFLPLPLHPGPSSPALRVSSCLNYCRAVGFRQEIQKRSVKAPRYIFLADALTGPAPHMEDAFSGTLRPSRTRCSFRHLCELKDCGLDNSPTRRRSVFTLLS